MSSPRVSIIIGSYLASTTIGRCLESLRAQTYRDFEVIVVDSSPDDETARVVAARFPEVRFERSATRLYCHEARNRGIELARGELLACLDADVYARPEWLATLVAEYERSGEVIVGAIACHGRNLRERAIHLCKFSKFLPAGPVRAIDSGPTANLLLARADFERAGGLHGDRYLADVELNRSLLAHGKKLLFAGAAGVEHHHTQSTRAFLAERFVRGRIFGRMRAGWIGRKTTIALYLTVSLLPIRIVKIAAHVFVHCARAGELGTLFLTWPLVMAGHAASLIGESVAYSKALFTRAAAEETEDGGGVHEIASQQ